MYFLKEIFESAFKFLITHSNFNPLTASHIESDINLLSSNVLDNISMRVFSVFRKHHKPVLHSKRVFLGGLQHQVQSEHMEEKRATPFERMQDCRDALSLLDRKGWKRSYHQRLFHEDFLVCFFFIITYVNIFTSECVFF